VLAGAGYLIVRGAPRAQNAYRHAHHLTLAAGAARATEPAAPATRAAPSAVITDAPTIAPTAAPISASASPTPQPSGPLLAIVIDDCGQWPVIERGFIAMPEAITLSVLPHVRYGTSIANDAHAAGKDVILHLPMEPRSGVYPGPGEVRVSMSDAAITAQVDDDLASVPLADGVNNHEGSRATSDDRVMRTVSAALAAHGGLFFLDSRTSAATVAERDAAAAGLRVARRDVFLDDVADTDASADALRHAGALARANGSAIAIGHPRATTLAAVRAVVPELEREGITIVPVRDVVH
jgi:polysaccharide deacetylase 2 family uncharacterized protein YibQ